jgi:hypothetical protein
MPRNAQTDPRHDFLPARESDLLAWSRNFRDHIIADAPSFGLSIAQASQYSALHDAYQAGYSAANNPNSNTKAAITAKNEAKKALKAEARALARIVQATPGVTDAQRGELGLTVHDPHLTPITRPSAPPEMYVLPSLGRTVRIRLRDKSSPDRLGRPLGTAGAVIMSYTGKPGETQPATSMAKWTFRGIATRRTFDVNMDADVPAGAQVWIAAMWFNTRGQLGAPSTAQSVRVGDGMSKLRLAA